MTECLVTPIPRSRSTFYIEMSMVLADASSDSSSNATFWASLIAPCLQGCSWPWRAVAGMHVALRVAEELQRLKMFCSLDFARLTADHLCLGSVTYNLVVTSQSPTRVDQFPIIHCKVASEVSGGGTRRPRILISSIMLKRSEDRGWGTTVKWLSGLRLCVCVRTCFVGCLRFARLSQPRAPLK